MSFIDINAISCHIFLFDIVSMVSIFFIDFVVRPIVMLFYLHCLTIAI